MIESTKREIGHLLTALAASFEGAPQGGNVGLLPSVRGLTAELAAWLPGEGRHSIWQIVNHVAIWDENLADVLAGKPAWPDGWWTTRDWQPIAQTTGEAWREALRRLTAAHAVVKAQVEETSDDRLDSVVGQAPLYASILGSALHKSYACGQIRYIRGLQGVPPEG
ncbi:MAG TPA: DinB family protein [bacterium]|jgi:hypothetical protein|nr:DinB family protein [bacterium]